MTAEQFIKDYTNHCSNELCYEEGLGNLYEPWLTPEQALRAVELARENLWKSADGDDLPEIDREVIVLLTNGKVCFAHRPNPDGWDGKSITTGEVKHYDVQTYDNGGWNIPDVKYWLDAPIPQEGGEE